MVTYTKASGSTTWLTDRASICITTAQCSLENGLKTSSTVLVRKYGQMVLPMTDAINLGKNTVLELLFGQITLRLLENSLMTKFMEEAPINGLMVASSLESGKTIK